MSDVVRCDLKGCPSTTVEHAVSAWLHVERSGVLTRRDQDPGPWDFCSWEHPYSLENTRLYRGSRVCRTCKRDRATAYRAQKRAA